MFLPLKGGLYDTKPSHSKPQANKQTTQRARLDQLNPRQSLITRSSYSSLVSSSGSPGGLSGTLPLARGRRLLFGSRLCCNAALERIHKVNDILRPRAIELALLRHAGLFVFEKVDQCSFVVIDKCRLHFH
jgi:hypothetical protein